MIDFSVVIPVRNNLSGLRVTLGAFDLFTAHKDRLEVLLIVDKDDTDLVNYLKISGLYTYLIKVCSVERSDNFCRDYYNFGANNAVGTNIMMFNDDCYVQTNAWDDIIRQKIAENPQMNGIYLIDLFDSTHEHGGASFPRFPMISSKAMRVLGFFFYPQIRMYPADKVIFEVYKYADAVIPCHKVKLQHDHISEQDDSKSRLFKIFQEDIKSGAFPVRIQKEIDKLKEAMK